jgi:hypothetical protein
MPQFDVTPKEYARRFNISDVTARRMFIEDHAKGEPFIGRCGIRTKRFPVGKLLRMDRGYYEQLKGRNEKT